jgi:hypothetical protein
LFTKPPAAIPGRVSRATECGKGNDLLARVACVFPQSDLESVLEGLESFKQHMGCRRPSTEEETFLANLPVYDRLLAELTSTLPLGLLSSAKPRHRVLLPDRRSTAAD